LFARSSRLRRGFARIFLYILAQNQTVFENQKSVFCPAGGQKERGPGGRNFCLTVLFLSGCALVLVVVHVHGDVVFKPLICV